MITAEELQLEEDRGHRWAKALLEQAAERPAAVRMAAKRYMFGTSAGPDFDSNGWRRLAKKQAIYSFNTSFMAGVELAIEKYGAHGG